MKYIIILVCLLASSILNLKLWNDQSTITESEIMDFGSRDDSPKSLQVFYNIEKYSTEYNIPKYIAYNISYLETRYRGPYQWDYSPKSSISGASGPMQIMVSTSRLINKSNHSKDRLKNDIPYNIQTGMKLLRILHDKYGDWGKACGAYNTGKPVINSYAEFCINNKDYKKNWINLKSYDKY